MAMAVVCVDMTKRSAYYGEGDTNSVLKQYWNQIWTPEFFRSPQLFMTASACPYTQALMLRQPSYIEGTL